MRRMHIHLAVEILEPSVEFYSALFGVRPTVFKPDYAKWMLDDPRVNFAISAHGRASGLDHLGIQVEGTEELTEVSARLQAAEQPVLEQPHANCCYARSDKAWSVDPQGIAWETFLITGESTVCGEDELVSFERPYTSRPQVGEVAGHGCCTPAMP